MFPNIAVSLLVFMTRCRSQWVSVTDLPLPRASNHFAIGTYGDSIFIMGGDPDNYQMVEYQISSNTMIDHGLSALSTDSYNHGAYFSQSQHTLYIERNTDIFVYDLSSPSFPSASSIPVDAAVTIGTAACTAATVDRVFVLGGWTTGITATVYMLTLSDNAWSTVPSMIATRVDEACIVVSDYVYAIGGWMTENERMNINDMIGFENIGTLTRSVAMPGVVSYDNIIWVIGGFDDSRTPVDEVWNIDITDGSVVLLDERLPYTLIAGFGGTIIANDALYVFGGVAASWETLSADWIKYQLAAPTTDPTNIPSTAPSEDPTNAPSKEPSKEPSNAPSDDPSDESSNAPSDGPSDNDNEGEVVLETTEHDNDGMDDNNNAPDSEEQIMNDSSMIWLPLAGLSGVFASLCLCLVCLLKKYKGMKVQVDIDQATNSVNESMTISAAAVVKMQKAEQALYAEHIGEIHPNTINVNEEGDKNPETDHEEGDHNAASAIQFKPDIIQGITLGGSDDEIVPHDTCTDCGKMENGKVFAENGLFYCFECWKYYEANAAAEK